VEVCLTPGSYPIAIAAVGLYHLRLLADYVNWPRRLTLVLNDARQFKLWVDVPDGRNTPI